MLRAIIFDFDGVIADTEKLHLRAFKDTFAARGIALDADEYYVRYVGLDDARVVRTLARDRGLQFDAAVEDDVLAQKVARYGRLIAAAPVLFDGVEPRVRDWSREVVLAIASGARRAEIDAILARHRLRDCFSTIVAAEDVRHGKPAPDPYLAALAGINRTLARRTARGVADAPAGGHNPAEGGSDDSGGVSVRGPIRADRVVAIEDSPHGVESARRAGMRCVAVTTNCPAAALSAAHLVVESVAAIDLEMLRGLWRD